MLFVRCLAILAAAFLLSSCVSSTKPGGTIFQSPPSELLVPENPFLPKLPDETPLSQGELLVAVAEDSAEYRRVVAKFTALQKWVGAELQRIRSDVGVTETPR